MNKQDTVTSLTALKKEFEANSEVMQAFINGKKIEWRNKGSDEEWFDVTSPSWNFTKCEYRIAPRTIWAAFTKDCGIVTYVTLDKKEAEKYYSKYNIVEFVEKM